MSQPLFSIVTPTLNRDAFLRQALDSVFAQEIPNFEVVIVAGGSSESTRALAQSYGERVRVTEQQVAQGPGAARNVGCRLATGKYLMFIDSDDVWFPWTLSTFSTIIQSEERPSWVMGSAIEFEREEALRSTKREAPRHTSFSDYLASSRLPLWVPGCNVAIRRETFEQAGGFTNECIGGEDSDLALRLGAKPGFVHVASPVTVGYRQHAQNTMKIFSRSVDGVRFQIQAERAGHYPGGVARRRERWQILTRHIRPVSVACLSHRMRAEAWEFYRASLKWHLAVGHWKYLLGFPIRAAIS